MCLRRLVLQDVSNVLHKSSIFPIDISLASVRLLVVKSIAQTAVTLWHPLLEFFTERGSRIVLEGIHLGSSIFYTFVYSNLLFIKEDLLYISLCADASWDANVIASTIFCFISQRWNSLELLICGCWGQSTLSDRWPLPNHWGHWLSHQQRFRR